MLRKRNQPYDFKEISFWTIKCISIDIPFNKNKKVLRASVKLKSETNIEVLYTNASNGDNYSCGQSVSVSTPDSNTKRINFQFNGTTGANDQDGIDEYEWAASAKVLGSEISIGYADDINSDISYWGAGATKTLGPLTVGSSYTIKDAATDLTGYDLTATTTLSLGDVTVGYGDKEGTGEYYTYGINKEIG